MRTFLGRSTWVLLAFLLALPHTASAQDNPQTREGFWIGFGLGWGSLGCSDCSSRESSGAGVLKLGGTINRQLLLGVESSAWTKKDSGVRLTHANVVFLAQFYPTPESGFFLQGGIGVSELKASASSSGVSVSASDNGLGLTAGAGYDVRVGTNVSITPYGLYSWGNFNGGNADHFQLGAGVTWH